MKILFTSTQPRHIYFASLLSAVYPDLIIVAEEKLYSTSKSYDSEAVRSHYTALSVRESELFADYNWPSSAGVINVPRGQSSSSEVISCILKQDINFGFVYGSSILKQALLDNITFPLLNFHQGVSPYYKGSGTNFWPIVNKEPQYLGATLHWIDPGVDTGPIVAHIFPPTNLVVSTIFDPGLSLLKPCAEKSLLIAERCKPINYKTLYAGYSQIPYHPQNTYKRNDLTEAAILLANDYFNSGCLNKFFLHPKRDFPYVVLN